MKIIHTADIHLDSSLAQVKDSAARRYELLLALSNMAEFANNNDVKAIVIAGDLFDNQHATDATISAVAEIIKRSKSKWFVLQGNHASSVPYVKLKNLAPQINLFESEWTYFEMGNVTICGREIGVDDILNYGKLNLDKSRYNLIVLHGDVDDDVYGLIDRKALAQSNANYIALGHRHSVAKYKFGEVKACYSGVLEARGFDEPEKTGFILIDTDKDEISFVEQHIRRIQTVTVDVTNIANDIALSAKISDTASSVDNRNYLNVVFCGALQGGVHLEMVARNTLEGRFFALRVENQTTTAYDLSSIASEVSLRGEFVKLANQIDDEKLKSEVLKMGLAVLSGEEIA